MEYDYISRYYGVQYATGQRVQHQITSRFGVVRPEGPSHLHYVRVLFQGDEATMFCHPTELDIIGHEDEELAA